MHVLESIPHALGAQASAVEALHESCGDRVGVILGAWATEYGTLNRVVALREWTGDRSDDSTAGDDWLSAEPVRRYLTPRRGLRTELLASPLLELRLYAPQPGQCERFVDALLTALPHRERYSPCAGVWTSRERNRDVVVHLWSYRSFDARLQARAAAMQDESWGAYRITIRPLLAAMQASLLMPLPR
jgi:NIPSNAP